MAVGFSLPQFPFKLTPEDMGTPNLVRAISQGTKMGSQPAQLSATLLGKHLENALNRVKASYEPERLQSEIDNTRANTGLTGQNTLKQKILNQYLGEREPAEIDQIKAQAKYYRQGGYGGSTGSKDYAAYQSGIMQDNPNLTPQQAREAETVYAHGGKQLSDGTSLSPLSFGTKSALDRTVRSATTAGQINQGLNANQADAELRIFSDLSSKWSQPYADTILGKSPEQIKDSFKNDDTSQDRLGKLIASNALQFEMAQVRNRIGMGAPGITSTKQMVQEGRQHIDTLWPRLSSKARKSANDSLNYAISEGLKARNKIGISPSALVNKQYENNSNEKPKKTEVQNKTSERKKEYLWSDIENTATLRHMTPNEVIDRLAKREKLSLEEFMKLVKRENS